MATGQATTTVEIPSLEEERAKGQRAMTVAWIFLWAAFVVFALLAFSIPFSISTYVASSTSPRQASLTVLAGTVLVRERGTKVELNAATGKSLEEGDQIRTTGNSQAVLWLPDGSNLRLWPNSEIAVQRLRSTTYSDKRWELNMLVLRGHTRVEVSLPLTEERDFKLSTPHGLAQLREGSFTVEVSDSETDIVARNGNASIGEKPLAIEIKHSERVTLRAEEPPEGPLPATRNLITKGDFERGLDGWITAEDAEESIHGTTTVVPEGKRNTVLFSRKGGLKHGENRLFQSINRDVSDLQSLQLKFDFLISEQTLSGGGWQGSEYPLQLRIKYRDVYDSETGITRGFYYQNTEKHPTPNGTQVPRNEWQSYSLDLFDLSGVNPRPNYLLSVEIVGSGWSYESRVANVRLEAE
jgi:hypothetical protein